MRIRESMRRVMAMVGPAAAATLLPFCAQADLDPALAPGGNFALDHWSLTLPADANGGTTGAPLTIKAKQLQGPRGYQSEWFYTGSDGAMTLWTPSNGATGNSPHPRCELREQIVSGSNSTNWDISGNSVLDAQLAVLAVPSDNGVFIGQIHDVRGGPLLLLSYVYSPSSGSGKLTAKVHSAPVNGSPSSTYTLATRIPLGGLFDYRVQVAQGQLTLSSTRGKTVTIAINENWADRSLYFKAGSYLMHAGSSASEGARVRFVRLAATHPNEALAISTPPALPDATAGLPYSTRLAAYNGAGGFVWSLVSGLPPAGLTLGADGLLSGTPASSARAATPHGFTALVRDAHGNTSAQSFQITIR